MVFQSAPPQSPEFFARKEKGNTSAYKFTEIGAKYLIKAFCYYRSAEENNEDFIRYCVKLSDDTKTIDDARGFLAEVFDRASVIVKEADSVNLLVGIIVKINQINSDPGVLTLTDGAKNGLFFKFSGQGAESKHLQNMSNACFRPPLDLPPSGTARHISQIFLEKKSFRHECAQAVLMGYHIQGQPDIFQFNVTFSISLPISTVNFNMNSMLRLPSEAIRGPQTLASAVFSKLNPAQREFQFMSVSPLASGNEFMKLLNDFENKDGPPHINKMMMNKYRHRIISFYNNSLTIISPRFRQFVPPAQPMAPTAPAASPRPPSSPPMMPPAPAASPRPPSPSMMPPAPAVSPRPPSSSMMPAASAVSPRPPSSSMMPAASAASPRPPSLPGMPAELSEFLKELGYIICMATGIGFALGYFHERSAIPDPKTGRYLAPRHRDLHLRNIMVYLNLSDPRDVECQVNMIDNADFAEAFDQNGFLIPEKLGELGYDLIYMAFIALHKTGGFHIGSQISGAQIRARGHQVMTATDFINVVFRSLFFGYLQSFSKAFDSLNYIFNSNWILAIGRSARKGVSVTPDLAHFTALGIALKDARLMIDTMSRKQMPPPPPPPPIVRG